MKYQVLVMPKAAREIKRLPASTRENMLSRIARLENDLFGDVKKLTNHEPAYRLRVGNYRVLFDIKGDQIIIQFVGHRRDIYD